VSTTAPSPPFARPDVGHIAAPDLIRLCHCKLPGKKIRDFSMLIAPTFVFIPRYLTTGDTQLFHQPTGQPSTEFYALCRDHHGDTSGTGGTPTGVPDLADQTAFNGTVSIRLSTVFTCVAITASVNTEQSAQ